MKHFKQLVEEFVDMAKGDLADMSGIREPFSIFQDPSMREWREIAKEQEETFEVSSHVTPMSTPDDGIPVRALFYPEDNALFGWAASAASHGFVNDRLKRGFGERISLTGFVKFDSVTLSPKEPGDTANFTDGDYYERMKENNPKVEFVEEPGILQGFG